MVKSVISKSIKGDNLAKIHLRLAPLIQKGALMLENICVKFDENNFNIMEAMAMSVFFKSLKGGNFIKMHYRVMSFGQNVALVMVNKFVKIDENSFFAFCKSCAEIC